MQLLHRLSFLGTLLLIAIPVQAQVSLYGTDDFADNSLASGRWGSFGTANGGLWTETNGRLEFTADASAATIITTNRAQQFRVWSSDPSGNTSYTDSWTATVAVTLDPAVVAVNGVQMIGVEAFMAGAPSGYYGLYLMYATSGGRVYTEQGLYNGSDYTRSFLGSTGNLAPAFDTSEVTLRLSYNGGTGAFSSGFSYDGGTTYFNYTTGGGTGKYGGSALGTTTGWAVSPTTGFGLEVYGALYGNGAQTSLIAASGQMYIDNLSVSAIPEPSTYAAIAGLACLAVALGRRRDAHGLALWRKLSQPAAAFFPRLSRDPTISDTNE